MNPLPRLLNDSNAIDITMPIFNGMWSYRPDWGNTVTEIQSTQRGDPSTVYRFDLCSHTGTYLETSQHKLNNDIVLDDFSTDSFIRPCKVVVIEFERLQDGEVTLAAWERALTSASLGIEERDAVIVVTGWGMCYRDSDFLSRSPYFTSELVAHLASLGLDLLGVDIPAIDNNRQPFGAVEQLFRSHPKMLLLAPLLVDPVKVATGNSLLIAAPLRIDGVSTSLCRAFLIQSKSDA